MAQNPGFRITEDMAPLKLCDLCSKISIDVFADARRTTFGNPAFSSNEGRNYAWRGDSLKYPLIHQPGFSVLKKSAFMGCDMCALFLDGVTKEVCKFFGRYKTVKLAHELFRKTEAEVPSERERLCLIEYTFEDGSMLRYAIPIGLRDGKYEYAAAEFIVRDYRGVGDTRVSATELALTPDWDITRGWVRECTMQHPECSTESISKGHPETSIRLLDLGAKKREEPRLVTADCGTTVYATLTHCWGQTRPLTTTLANLQSHFTSIPFSSLPKTFQDAVIVTRELGIRYLWIDSLCIVQDSIQDWEVECAKMARIYQGSLVTICGPNAVDSSAGFIKERTYSGPAPHLWEYCNSDGTKLRRATISLMGHSPSGVDPCEDYPEKTSLTRFEEASRVGSRGWILQEYLLSPRLLFIGFHRMYWTCNNCIRFEDFPCKRVTFSLEGPHCKIPKRELKKSAGSNVGLEKMWYKIVREYSQRSLTEPGDKLPALSGVAAWFLDGVKENYLAGLLKQDLHVGLTWHIDSRFIEDARQRPDGYRAPSWSWASTDHMVFFVIYYDGARPVDPDGPPWDLLSMQYRLQIHDAYITTHGHNPFGQVTAGTIKLQGKLWTGTVHIIPRLVNPTGFAMEPQIDIRDPGTGKRAATFYPDDRQRWGLLSKDAPIPLKDYLSLRDDVAVADVECVLIDYSREGFGDGQWVALVVEPHSAAGTPDGKGPLAALHDYQPYHRVGLAQCSLKFYGDVDQFRDCPWKKIELF